MTTVNTVRKSLEDAFSTTVRTEILNAKLHFVPIDVDIYRLVLGNYLRTEADLENDPGYVASVEEIVKELTEFTIARHTKPAINIKDTKTWEDVVTNPDERLPAIVYSDTKLVGVLYGSFNKTYDGIFKNFIRTKLVKYLKDAHYEERRQEKLLQKASGKKVAETNIPKGFDIGHIAGIKEYAVSPLLEKINRLDSILDTLVGTTVGSQQQKLQEIQQEVKKAKDSLYEQSSYASKITGYLEKDVSDFLVSVTAVLVIPQDALENRYFYGTKIESIINKQVADQIQTTNFSRNIDEEIEFRYLSALQGIKVAPAKHKQDLGKISRTAPKPSGQTSISAPTPGSIPKVSTASNKLAVQPSLASLQALINQHLQDVISANMGGGNSRNVLNYRTGRFASSVKVERMSQSREGMITAFYSYMQNPYGTFSGGGRQEYPKSRDPKLLISTSIREIAATKVANRMRAVLA